MNERKYEIGDILRCPESDRTGAVMNYMTEERLNPGGGHSFSASYSLVIDNAETDFIAEEKLEFVSGPATTDDVDETVETDETDETVETDETDETEETDKTDETDETDKTEESGDD